MRPLLAIALISFLALSCESHPNVDFRTETPVPLVPGIPAGVGATGEPSSVRVQWSSNRAEDEVTSYTVYSALGEWQSWSAELPEARNVSAPCCEIVMSNLNDESVYSFAVTATNAIGEGAMSPSVSALPPGWAGTFQIGTTERDSAGGIAVDSSGAILVVGTTAGTFPGNSSSGGDDVFVAKYDASGKSLWIRQFGSGSDDAATGVAVDSLGTAFVVGTTDGSLPGTIGSAGLTDGFVAKLTPEGIRAWTVQFGTSGLDSVTGVAVASGSAVFISGATPGDLNGNTQGGNGDAFVVKLDASNGAHVWTYQYGTTAVERAIEVAADPDGNVYYAGDSASDILVGKLSPSKAVLWGGPQIYGSTINDYGRGIAVGLGMVFVAGHTDGALEGNFDPTEADFFATRFDLSNGNRIWTTTGGTVLYEGSTSASINETARRVFVTGIEYEGSNQVFLAGYDTAGNLHFRRTIDSGGSDVPGGLAPHGAFTYLTGHTTASFVGEPHIGDFDVFVMKLDATGAAQ